MTNASSTEGTALGRLSDAGISITKTGTFEVDNTKLDAALANNFTDLSTIFSAGTTNQSEIGTADRGIAGDISKVITDLSASSGYITTQTASLNSQIAEYQIDLTELETRMTQIEERYTRQFLSMQRVVDEMTRTKDDLISTFDNLPFTKKNS
jgi:flagellar hook-associated protein 2